MRHIIFILLLPAITFSLYIVYSVGVLGKYCVVFPVIFFFVLLTRFFICFASENYV